MNKYDTYEAIIVAGLMGFIFGAVIASAIWANKVAHYEQQIDTYNKEVRK
jgi:ABC-type transport system involved in cytochrome c biogenesis permease subunit